MVIESNKEKYKYMCEHVICPCDSKVMRSNMTTHKATMKHKKWLSSQDKLTDEEIDQLKAIKAILSARLKIK